MRTNALLLLFCIVSFSLNAQMKINSGGKISFGANHLLDNGRLKIGNGCNGAITFHVLGNGEVYTAGQYPTSDISDNIKTAQLCIHNLQGSQIKQILISERGEGSQWISGSELSAGMYLYALIVDGKEVDVKRMILTK